MDGWIIKNKEGKILVKSREWHPSHSAKALLFTGPELDDFQNKAEEAGVILSDLKIIPARLEDGKVLPRSGYVEEF